MSKRGAARNCNLTADFKGPRSFDDETDALHKLTYWTVIYNSSQRILNMKLGFFRHFVIMDSIKIIAFKSIVTVTTYKLFYELHFKFLPSLKHNISIYTCIYLLKLVLIK